jgi:hypothetical protein
VGDIGVDGGDNTEMHVKVMDWNLWLLLDPVLGLCEHINEPSGFIK